MEFRRTDGQNEDFIENCRLLDMDLDRRVGKEIKREKYKKFNGLDEIREAISRCLYQGISQGRNDWDGDSGSDFEKSGIRGLEIDLSQCLVKAGYGKIYAVAGDGG